MCTSGLFLDFTLDVSLKTHPSNYIFNQQIDYLLDDVINVHAKYKKDNCAAIFFQTFENIAYLESFWL